MCRAATSQSLRSLALFPLTLSPPEAQQRGFFVWFRTIKFARQAREHGSLPTAPSSFDFRPRQAAHRAGQFSASSPVTTRHLAASAGLRDWCAACRPTGSIASRSWARAFSRTDGRTTWNNAGEDPQARGTTAHFLHCPNGTDNVSSP